MDGVNVHSKTFTVNIPQIFYLCDEKRLTYHKRLTTFFGANNLILEDTKQGIAFTVYMRREGRVTVPKELRDAYDLKEGDLVECKIRKIK